MPLGKNVRYRVKTTQKGKKVRLAWKGGKVVEAKNLETGAVHGPQEFAADRKKGSGPRSSVSGPRSAPAVRRKSLKRMFSN